MKAFLSHSSKDKELVRYVAHELGRQFCLFDEQVFKTGVEFRNSIEKSFEQTSLFVLFASQEALKSTWVEFEIEEAWYRKLQGSLRHAVVFLIDSSLTHSHVPQWLQRSLVVHQNSAQAIARTIRERLHALLEEQRSELFLGRNDELNKLEKALTPLGGDRPPRSFWISGLPSIGRRSIVRQGAKSVLSMSSMIVFRIAEEDNIKDIAIQVASKIEPYNTEDGLKRIIDSIENLDESSVLKRTVANLSSINENRELPVFFDEGGLLTPEGQLRDEITEIVSAISQNDRIYLCFVSNRRPLLPAVAQMPVLQVRELNQEWTQRLLLAIADQYGVQLETDIVRKIARSVAGFPPAAYYAVHQVKDYGADLLVADIQKLADYRSETLRVYLTSVNLSGTDSACLRLLGTLSPLPYTALCNAIGVDEKVFAERLRRLADLALIYHEDGLFRIAEPVEDTVRSMFGVPDDTEARVIIEIVSTALSETVEGIPRLDLSRVVFRASHFTFDTFSIETARYLAKDLASTAEQLYHARRYDRAIAVAREAVVARPNAIRPRKYLAKALVQQERWKEAEEPLAHLERIAPASEWFFERGFAARRKKDFTKAIHCFTEARRCGRKGSSVARELASCHLFCGHLTEARAELDPLFKGRQGNNPWILHLWSQITTRQRDQGAARQALDRLKILKPDAWYHHRESRYAYAFGDKVKALQETRAAIRAARGITPFEIAAQHAYCEIEVGNLEKAKRSLDSLDREYGNVKHDIRFSLRVRLCLKEGNGREAISLCRQIREQDTIVYKRLLRDALVCELERGTMMDSQRADYLTEVERLETELEAGTPEVSNVVYDVDFEEDGL